MWDYIFLGILQGIFEWIPISSEGILVLVSKFLAQNINVVDLALFLHLGTFLAVIIYFRKDWRDIILRKNPKLFRFLLISTSVSLILGFPVYKLVKNVAIGPMFLILMGTALLFTAFFNKSKNHFTALNLEKESNRLAILTGLLQGLSIIPGLSRSGSTIFGLSFSNFSPSEILKISYLMSGPVVLAANIYLALNDSLVFSAWPALIASFLVGITTLSFLMKLSEKMNFFIFTLIFAILCLVGGAISLFVGA